MHIPYQNMLCPICKQNGEKSKIRFIDHSEIEEAKLWDYDEEGNVVERNISVRIKCSNGHETEAHLRGVLDKAEQT